MTAYFDLPIEAKAQFPAHGWIKGSTGVRHLRFPLLRVFQIDHPAYEKYQAHGLAGIWLQTRSPFRTLRQLSIALRDLHSELRSLLLIVGDTWPDQDEVSEEQNIALNKQDAGLTRCGILLLPIFVLLRRLADDIMDSLRPALFEHWESAPRQLKSIIKYAEKGCLQEHLYSLKPYCDTGTLSDVLSSNFDWLERLRKEDGVRDTLIHRPHLLSVTPCGNKPVDSERFTWQIKASLIVETSDGFREKSLLPVLLNCLAGACEFMTAISRLISGLEDFDRGDFMPLTGHDNDIVGFWPAIGGGQHEFPMHE